MEPFTKNRPLEYAVELSRLMELQRWKAASDKALTSGREECR